MTSNKQSSQKFGGAWTEAKLDIFTAYLDAYLTALKNQKFRKVYIDAFAGTGEIEASDGQHHFVGSAKRALSAKMKFDHYYFIEQDPDKSKQLQDMIALEFPDLVSRTTVYSGDANSKLTSLISSTNWHSTRGLLFLDPYATQVAWKTLETIADTSAIDMWYLFPFNALIRMLPNDGEYHAWESCIDRLLGTPDWRTEFYKEDPQISFFDSPNFDGEQQCKRVYKDANPEHIKSYILSRLTTIFPCVSQNPRVFKNTRQSPLFLFCFAISNKSKSAQRIGLRIADYILKKVEG